MHNMRFSHFSKLASSFTRARTVKRILKIGFVKFKTNTYSRFINRDYETVIEMFKHDPIFSAYLYIILDSAPDHFLSSAVLAL